MSSDRHLAATISEAIRQRDLQRAAGASIVELAQNLERTIRAAWPKSKKPWIIKCADCEDTGLMMFECTGLGGCSREKPHQAHTYGIPCACGAGLKFQAKAREDVAEAGRVRRKPTRWGR